MSVEILKYRYIGGQSGESEEETGSSISPRQFQLLVKDSDVTCLKSEGLDGYYWINLELAGSLWPLAVADFYLDHLVIHQPLELEDGEEDEEEDEVQGMKS